MECAGRFRHRIADHTHGVADRGHPDGGGRRLRSGPAEHGVDASGLLPGEALGRAAATWQVATGLLTPAGALVGAALAETIGMRPTLWVLAFGILAAALWLVAARDALPGRRIG